MGLSLLRSGMIALPEKCRPLISSGPTSPAARQMPISGSITHSSCSSRSPKWPNSAIGFSRIFGSGLSAVFIQTLAPSPMPRARAISANTPVPNTAAVDNSRDCGMLPCSRASRRRFSVGSSVRSPPSSDSDIGGR